MSIRVFLEDLSIWVSRLRDKTHPHQSGRPHPLLRAQVEQRRGGRVNSLSLSLSLSRDTHFFLCFNIWALELGLCTCSGSYIISPPCSWFFRLELKSVTGFPVSPACRWHIRACLTLHNHVNQLPKCLLLFISVYATGFISLENPVINLHTYFTVCTWTLQVPCPNFPNFSICFLKGRVFSSFTQ